MVQLQQITKRFGDYLAVDSVSLQINPGEFLTLLGPSGCGKTTLLRLISGFEHPTSGHILLDHHDVSHLPPYKRDVNQVFQSYALFPHLSVEANVAFGLKMKKVPKPERRARVAEAIDLVSLSGFEHRKPSQLSGGQKQRVALARALVCRPKVLLLDEPLAALDAKLRRSMQIELKRLQHRVGITFVFVTHDQEEALVMSDRIAVMNHGRIEQLGPAAEVYRHPSTPFVADFLGQANVLKASLLSTSPTECHILVNNSHPLTLAPLNGSPSLSAIVIRPENISLSLTPQSAPNEFPATLTDQINRGPTHQLLLNSPLGPLTALRTDPLHTPPGSPIFCNIDPSDIVPLT